MKFGIGVIQISDNKHIFLLIAALLVISMMPMHLLSPVLIVLLGLMLGVLIISVFAPSDFNFLINVYAIGFAARVLASFLFYTASYVFKNGRPGFLFSNDGWSYSQQGWQIYKFAKRGIRVTMETFAADPNMMMLGKERSGNITSYDFFASHVYSITGYSPLSLFFISSVAGSIAALFIYLIAKELFSERIAKISALFAFFWPSFILWSTQNLKDSMIAMFIFILLWSLFYARKYLTPGFLLLSIVSILVLSKIGIIYLVIIGAMVLFTGLFLFINHLSKSKLIAFIILSFLCVVFYIILSNKVLKFVFEKSSYVMNQGSLWEFLDYSRNVRAYGNLKFLKGVDISSAGKAMLFAPLGLFFALFAPFPWQIGNIIQIMAVPETILFYMLVPFTIKGIIFGYKKRFNDSIVLLSIIFGLLLFLALVEGNTGTLFRHRSIAFYLIFIFTSIGISLKKENA